MTHPTTYATPSIEKRPNNGNFDKKLVIMYAISIGVWVFDFRAIERGAGFLVQGLTLLGYVCVFCIILLQAAWKRFDWQPLQPFLLISGFFLICSITVGAILRQNYWLLFTNCIPIALFMSSTFSTYMLLRFIENRLAILDVLKTLCIAFIVVHFTIASFQYGLDLSTSRYQFLSGATVPALAIFAMGMIFPFQRKEIIIAVTNLIAVLISVTRTQLPALALQIGVCITFVPKSFFQFVRFKKAVGPLLVVCLVIAIDLISETGLTTRWVERLLVQSALGYDPTALTRTAENNFMWQQFVTAWDTLAFGNGLAAETSLIGPEAFLAGQLVGRISVISIHSNGFGHNNHLSLLFIGGLLAGLPFLLLLFLNAISAMRLTWILLRTGTFADTVVYTGVWGSLIIIGLVTIGFVSGIFGDRVTSLWYGIGTGMFYWVKNEVSRSRGHAIRLHTELSKSRGSTEIRKYSVLPVAALVGASFLLSPLDANAQRNLTAETNRPLTSTYSIGEQVELTFSVKPLNGGEGILLILDIRDEFGKSILRPSPIKLFGDINGIGRYQFSAPSNRLGYYEIWAKLSDGTSLVKLGTRDAGFITYAIVPDPLKRVDYGDLHSRFGLQGGFNKLANVLPYLGVRYIIAGNDWTKLEPLAPGQFIRDLFKAASAGKKHPLKNESSQNLQFLGKPWTTYAMSIISDSSLPAWTFKPETAGTICKRFGALNERGAQALPAFALAQAKVFALDYANQNKRYYQVTWEPGSGWCFQGTSKELVEIYSSSFQPIHQSDPLGVVSGPTLFIDSESTKQLHELLSAGFGKYIDALSFHPYVKHFPPENNGLPTILREQLRAANAAAGRQLPFIGTEHGFRSTADGNLNKALGDIRTTLIMLGEGAEFDFGFYIADYWSGDDLSKNEGYGFYWNLNPRIAYGTDKLGPKAVVPAYAAMSYFLDGTTTRGPLVGLTGSQMGYRFVRYSTIIDVVWDYATKSKYSIPSSASICDWMGNCVAESRREIAIDNTPIYCISQSAE